MLWNTYLTSTDTFWLCNISDLEFLFLNLKQTKEELQLFIYIYINIAILNTTAFFLSCVLLFFPFYLNGKLFNYSHQSYMIYRYMSMMFFVWLSNTFHCPCIGSTFMDSHCFLNFSFNMLSFFIKKKILWSTIPVDSTSYMICNTISIFRTINSADMRYRQFI